MRMAFDNIFFLFGLLLSVLSLSAGLFIFAAIFTYIWYQYNKSRLLNAASLKWKKDYEKSGPDVIIIGGGVVGSALAAVLARDGRRVTVIERSMTTPDTITGEALLAVGKSALEQLGLSDCLEGIDIQTFSGSVIQPDEDNNLEVPYTNGAYALRQCLLVDTLRQAARKEENCEFLEGTVAKLIEEGGCIRGVQYHLKGNEQQRTMRAPLTVVANGRFSKLRSVNVISKPSVTGSCTGIDIDGARSLNMEFMVFPGVNLIYKYARSSTNIRYLIWSKEVTVSDRRKLLEDLSFRLPKEHKDLWNKAVETSRIRYMPEHQLAPILTYKPGAMTIGDAMSLRSSIPAAGQSVGFNDVLLWRELLRKIPSLDDHKALKAAHNVFALQRKLKYSFNIDLWALTANTLHIPESDAAIKMAVSFLSYISDKGREFSDVQNINSGLEPRPRVMLRLLCVVIAYAMKRAISDEHWWGLPRGIYRATTILSTASSICIPFLWSEWRSIFVF